MVPILEALRTDLGALRRDIRNVQGTTINKKVLRDQAKAIGTRWFAEAAPVLTRDHGIAADVVERYSAGFGRLIRISAPANLKSSYEETLNGLLRRFRDDLILPIQTRPAEIAEITALERILSGLPDPAEDAYLTEAIECARHGLLRGAAVLGWSAAIDRIHRAITKGGLDKFNNTSLLMTQQTKGRFKKFNQTQHVGSLSELREVFDKIVLWIIEGMQLIDVNQHTRLASCYELRGQCAHPGDAPITEPNLVSFFSDLNEIVFRNPKFAAPSAAELEPPGLVVAPSTSEPPEAAAAAPESPL